MQQACGLMPPGSTAQAAPVTPLSPSRLTRSALDTIEHCRSTGNFKVSSFSLSPRFLIVMQDLGDALLAAAAAGLSSCTRRAIISNVRMNLHLHLWRNYFSKNAIMLVSHSFELVRSEPSWHLESQFFVQNI